MNIQKVTLKFIGTGMKNEYQACVNIYDAYNDLYHKKTYNGKLVLCLKENKAYKLVANSCIGRIVVSFYVDKYHNSYTFILGQNQNMRTITLTDANYNNLPIERGMIIWQKQ